jgi:predicted branched-subunit amino acid permease
MNGIRKRAGGEVSLWLSWVFANAVGEALGLGSTALIGAAVVSSLGEGTSALATLALGQLGGEKREREEGNLP